MATAPRSWFQLARQHRAIQRGARVGWMEMCFEEHGAVPQNVERRATIKISFNLVLRGSGTFIDHHDRRYTLKPGILFMRLPGLEQQSIYDEDSDYAECHISIDRFTSAELLQAALINTEQVCCALPLSKANLQLIKSFYDLLARQDAQIYDGSLLLQALALIDHWQRLSNDGIVQSPEAQKVKQACQIIVEHGLSSLALADVAAQLHISEVQLRRAFGRQLGMSPRTWYSRYRFGRACELLSELPVNEVAERLGFCDPYSFSTQFKKHMGVSPSHYRS